jgi:hypothetical protein
MARGPAKHWSTAWLAVAACVGFGAGAAETGAPGPGEDWEAATEPLLASIEQEEARNGPFSPDLIDLLTSLGLAYQENDRHDLALAIFDRALYLRRFNDGLFGLDQAALVKRLIASEIAMGRVNSAAELEERLLELARRNPLDPRASQIFREAAERELDYYERYLRGENPPGITIFEVEGWQRAAAARVLGARQYYHAAKFALLGNPGEHQAELAELEERLARTYYLQASARDRRYRGPADTLYGLGLVTYQRRLGYAQAGSGTAADYAQMLVELADWSLLFSRNGTAVKRYAEAHALLVEQRAPAAAFEELFPADIPVFLPTFESPLAEAASLESNGYIDVDFEIGKYGQPRNVKIVAVAGDDAAATSKELAAAINNGRFRPSPLADAERWTAYRVRYSLADGSVTPRL